MLAKVRKWKDYLELGQKGKIMCVENSMCKNQAMQAHVNSGENFRECFAVMLAF